jgi:16S rRNA (guanine966-N2)-methyltransferase
MTDKVKGALFNTLLSLGVEPDRILDLYAGTGAIGIEALSRGGSWATFVDKGREQCATIRWNLDYAGFTDRAEVKQAGVDQFVESARAPYDFIMMDPPYADPDIVPVLERVAASQLLQPDTIVVVGHAERVPMPDTAGRLERLKLRCHGDSCFSIYEVAPDDESVPEPAGKPEGASES